eukprot:scaffold8777_cov297-Ochromonas_danica.AAC.4
MLDTFDSIIALSVQSSPINISGASMTEEETVLRADLPISRVLLNEQSYAFHESSRSQSTATATASYHFM